MDIRDLTNVSRVVINSLLMVLKQNDVDVDAISMQLSASNGDYVSDEVNLGELAQQTLEKLKSTLEGFVLVPKDELTTTYYWEGTEHTVNCVSEYEMELEKGEIAELEKWEQTKSTKAFFANIYSDEDNFEIVEFDSIEAAELAIKENKAMIEAQEQSHD
ncbi:hypothetical protein ABIC56_002904 [Acinetobacter bereziniae]|uniref:hypothetical protein n=1 Tax=Acinetobacter bereziniae TaxID=106648 RepID=UPI0028566CE1|nr:hypothetical protein [Acinetobacter bereziniae]MDR6542929.1 hypothetical protein [Acinetobacter bereziniae]